MQAVHDILNALIKAFDRRTVIAAVEGWVATKRAEEFFANNPGFRFGNEGERYDASGAAVSVGGAALRPTANGSGHYGYFTGIPDAVDTEQDAEDRLVAANTLVGLAAADPAVESLAAAAAALTVSETAADEN